MHVCVMRMRNARKTQKDKMAKMFAATMILLPMLVEGLYQVQVRVTSYSNPSHRCSTCHTDSGAYGCCDVWQDSSCSGENRCDNYFIYCLRPLRSTTTVYNCGDYSQFRSSALYNDAEINFAQSTVLGLNNPLVFNGITDTWTGVQLFVIVIDEDIGSLAPDDPIDTFAINITVPSTSIGVETDITSYAGIFGLAEIELQYEVRCAENYYGDLCENLNECVGVTCNGNGQCVDGIGGFSCDCNPGFTGGLCEVNVDECIGVDCNGNGQCMDGVSSFSCDCNPGFAGSLCEMNIDDCFGVDCNENGQCVDGINGFSCDCNPGFTGSLCEININDCIGINCNGNGQCQDGVNSFSCVCNSGFTGESCESEINECIETSCSGNGYCVDQLDSFTCVCNSGFTGPLCETNIDDCVGVNCSGNGLCTDGIGEYGCVCFSGYYGINCENTPGEQDPNEALGNHDASSDHHQEVIFGSAGGGAVIVTALIITVGVVVCVLCKRRRGENEHDKPVFQGTDSEFGSGVEITLNRNQSYGVAGSYEDAHVGSRRDPVYVESDQVFECYDTVL